MPTPQVQLYNALKALQGNSAGLELSQPDPTIEDEVLKIYSQARRHRTWLIIFYIVYTTIFSLVVIAFMVVQACIRIKTKNPSFEIMPQWGLNLLVVGMFGQFISLLAIVTKNVWNFEPFLKHHKSIGTK